MSSYSSFEIEAPDTSKVLKKTSKASHYIATSLMCLFCILNIVFLVIILTNHFFSSEKNFSELLPLIDYISSNLNTPPIRDLQVAEPNLSCPQDFSLIRFITWPGTVLGCYCPETGEIYQGSCTKTDAQTCMPLAAIDSQILWVWKNDGLCVQRTNDYYLKPKERDCKDGYNNCGRFCVNQNEICPITSLAVVPKDSEVGAENENIEKINLASNRNLVVKREFGVPPLYDIDIHFYEKICLQPTFRPDANGPKYPILEVNSFVGCGEYGYDESSVSIENMDMLTVLSQNNISTQSLPLFNIIEKDTIAYLITRPRIAVSSESAEYCQTVDVRNLSVLNDLMGSFKKWVSGATIFPLILIISYWIYLVYLLCDKGLKKFVKKSSKKWTSWVPFTVCFIIIILYKLYTSGKNQDILDQQGFYAALGSADCFENHKISEALTSFALQIPLGTAVIMNYVSFIFWASVSIFILTMIAIGYPIIYKNFFD